MALHCDSTLTLRTYECIVLRGNGEFRLQMEIRLQKADVKNARLSWIIRGGPAHSQGSLKVEGTEEGVREMRREKDSAIHCWL